MPSIVIKSDGFDEYTTIIDHKKTTNNTATQIFTKKGPLAFLPVSNSQTSIVYSVNEIQNKFLDIKELIKKYNFKYEIEKINKIETFKLKGLNLDMDKTFSGILCL